MSFLFIDLVGMTLFIRMTNTIVYSFKPQLTVGDHGEHDFLCDYQSLSPIKSTKDLTYDFLLSNGLKVELKTDDHDMFALPNFFLEKKVETHSTGKEKIGGPWRAAHDGVDLFVYYFLKHRTYFWMSSIELVQRAEQHLTGGRWISNDGYSAYGYPMRRSLFTDIILRQDNYSVT